MKKKITNFVETCKHLPDAAGCDAAEKVKLSLVNLAFLPVGLVTYFYRHFFNIAGLFALLLTALTLALGAAKNPS